MTKLKTLKDIEMVRNDERLEICEINDLRQVAREWIEELDTKNIDYWGREAIRDWIRYFFNLESVDSNQTDSDDSFIETLGGGKVYSDSKED